MKESVLASGLRAPLQSLLCQQIGKETISPVIVGIGQVVLRLDGTQTTLAHETAQFGGSADNIMVFELLSNAAVAITAAVAFEDLLDERTEAAVLKPGGHVLGSVVKAAVRQLQDVADLTDAVLGGCE